MTGFDIVVSAVIRAFNFRNFGATRERARGFQRGHDGLGSGIHKSNLIKAIAARADVLRMQNFLLGSHHESAAARKLRGDSFNNWRVRVSVNKRCDIVGKVNARDAINVRDAATFSVRNIGRHR